MEHTTLSNSSAVSGLQPARASAKLSGRVMLRAAKEKVWHNAGMSSRLSRIVFVIAVALGVLYGLQAIPGWAFLVAIFLALLAGIIELRGEHKTRDSS